MARKALSDQQGKIAARVKAGEWEGEYAIFPEPHFFMSERQLRAYRVIGVLLEIMHVTFLLIWFVKARNYLEDAINDFEDK